MDPVKAQQYDSALAAKALEQAGEMYLLFPHEFDELEKIQEVHTLWLEKLETLRSRIQGYHILYPLAQVHPDTLQQTLETFDRCKETLEKLSIQIPKCRATLHESAAVRKKRLSQRAAAKKPINANQRPEGT